ncbi:hypothetical protein ACFWXO_17140 [Kitasatospora sp. NPDC059088]|uniref:hypothetical protein n=1 Tax=Kitasatospora sp. NPDC059088 TaxID=3346722 RepID=UPI00368462B3
MNLPARRLSHGDVTVHTASGSEAVVTEVFRIGSSHVRQTVRTVTGPTRGDAVELPDAFWQFPRTHRLSGSHRVPVLAYLRHDPDDLPPVPYPAVPGAFAPGDRVLHDGVRWERTRKAWYRNERAARALRDGDRGIRRLFTDHRHLRRGIPEYLPAPSRPDARG